MHILDVSIIIAFLVAILYIGLVSGKKIKTFDNYTIGNRKFSDFAICCTVAATVIGGSSTMGNVGMVYNVGIIQFLAQFGGLMAYFVVGTFLARRFSKYYGCHSLGDIFYKGYGTFGKVIAGIAGCFYEILLVSLQFTAMGTAISVLTGFSYIISLLISAGIILIYTGRGGIRAVTFTDVLQLIVLIVAFPILLISVLGDIGGLHALMERLPKSHLTIMNEHLPRYLFFMIFIVPTLAPHHIQRLLMMRNGNQGVKAYRNVTAICLFLAIVVVFLGLSAKVLLPDLEQYDDALLTLIINYLPTGIFGIAVIGILAVLMSTADSYLNIGSIMLVNDLMVPYFNYKKRDFSDAEKLKWARRFSLFIGLGAIIFASLRIGIFELGILIEGFWFSAMLVPLYFLVFNMKLPIKHFILSASIGLFTFIFWENFMKPITNIDSIFPGFLSNIIIVFLFYILGGRQKVFTKKELDHFRYIEEKQTEKHPNFQDLQTKNNTFLGLCLIFLQLMPLVLEPNNLTYSKLLLILINSTMAILLVFGSSLEIFAKQNRLKWLKLTTLFFCLPITSAYLFLTSTENGLSVITLLLSFIVMFLSVEKQYEGKIISVCLVTTLITTIIYFKTNCTFCWPEMFYWQHTFYLFGYLAVLFLLHSNLNTLRKEKELAVYLERYNIARSLSHDIITPLMVLRLLLTDKSPNKLDEKECKLVTSTLEEMGACLDDFISGSLKSYDQLTLESINQNVISCIEKNKVLYKTITVQMQAKENVFARVDSQLFRRTLNNLIGICMEALPEASNTVVISVGQDKFGNKQILLKNDLGSFSAKKMERVLNKNQKLSDELRFGIGFQELQNIVQTWHGKLGVLSNDNEATIQMLLPNEKNQYIIEF